MADGRYGPAPPPGLATLSEHLAESLAHDVAAHEGAVLTVRFNSQGTYCLSGGKDHLVKLWNPHKGLLIKTYAGHAHDVRDADVRSDNSQFASCSGDRSVIAWDVSTAKVLRRFRGHAGPVNAVRFGGPEGSLLASAGYDRAVCVWDCRSRAEAPAQRMLDARDSVTSLEMARDRPEILAAGVDGSLRRYDVRAGRLAVDELRAPLTCVRLTPDGAGTLLACADGAVRLLDRAEGDLVCTYVGHAHADVALQVAASRRGDYVIAGSEDGRVLVWELVGQQRVLELEAHQGACCALEVQPGGSALLTGGADGRLKLWV